MLQDHLLTFMFKNTDIRGGIVTLEQSMAEMLATQSHSQAHNNLLSEFAAATILLSSHIKFQGVLTLQAWGGEKLELVMAECTDNLEYRGIIRGDSPIGNLSFSQIMAGSLLSITISPQTGQQYQGIVPLENNSLAACLEDYFRQSEQLPSRFLFFHSTSKVTAIMLQTLPGVDNEKREEDWDRITHLASTMTAAEASSLTHQELLYRLYHQENVLLFAPKPVTYHCNCSRERMERGLLSLGTQELFTIMEEQPEITLQCHFCAITYQFSRADILQLTRGAGTKASH